MSRTKIVATIGPGCIDVERLRAVFAAGADVARLNGSHADLAWHAQAIGRIRAVLPATPILFDVPGRKIRTRVLGVEPAFAVGGEIVLTRGEADGTDGRVGVTSQCLHDLVRPGDRILADDGTLAFTVSAIDGEDVHCRAETAGRLRSGKGINLPGVDLSGSGLTDRDRATLDFAREQAVDFVGISFVDGSALLAAVRERLGPHGPRVVAKIESLGGLNHLDEVIAAADAVMIDRGDLSVETNLEGIAIAQKRIVLAARQLGKPVIIATEMLDSMVESPVPTKAEVSDISNAILDGASAIMLSAETAIGRYPVESVATMRRIADVVDGTVVPALPDGSADPLVDGPKAMGEAIALLARTLPITKIVAITRSGYAARIVANFRPRQEILVVTDDAASARSASLLFGCRGVAVDVPFLRRSTDHIAECLRALWLQGLLGRDDFVLVTSVGYPRSGRRMNLIQTHGVADLEATLGWPPPLATAGSGSVEAAAVAPAAAPARRVPLEAAAAAPAAAQEAAA